MFILIIVRMRQFRQVAPDCERKKMETVKSKSNKQRLKGVKPAKQVRSIALQDKFSQAGREMLKNTRLADIRIPDLAKKAGSSIGGFYSRFEDKDVFFKFMQAYMLEDHSKIVDQALAPEHLKAMSDVEVIENFVTTMIKIFTSPWRGVLRESYSRISEGRGIWAPMRNRGRKNTDIIVEKFAEQYSGQSNGTDEESIRFAIQILYSALNNDLMNPKLKFSIGDKEFEHYLSRMLCKFLELRP